MGFILFIIFLLKDYKKGILYRYISLFGSQNAEFLQLSNITAVTANISNFAKLYFHSKFRFYLKKLGMVEFKNDKLQQLQLNFRSTLQIIAKTVPFYEIGWYRKLYNMHTDTSRPVILKLWTVAPTSILRRFEMVLHSVQISLFIAKNFTI